MSLRNDYKDADFDSYWEEEARNPNRNRIRIGRQYQATVPPILKPGEVDGRRCEDLETLKFKPDNELTEQQLDEYLSLAKAVSFFARAIDNKCNNANNNTNCSEENVDNINNEEENGATDNGQTNNKSTSDSANNNDGDDGGNDEAASGENEPTDSEKKSHSSPLQSSSTDHLQSALKGLNDFVTSPSSYKSEEKICQLPLNDQETCQRRREIYEKCPFSEQSDTTLTANLSSSPTVTSSTLNWNKTDVGLFRKALSVCGKNFCLIKKDFLPWKSVKCIIEYYYLKLAKMQSMASATSPAKNNDKDDETNDEGLDLSSTKSSRVKLNDIIASTSTGSLTKSLSSTLSSPSLLMARLMRHTTAMTTAETINGNNGKNSETTTTSDEAEIDLSVNKEDNCRSIKKENDLEVKPIKGKAIHSNGQGDEAKSTLGSLKFYMDGQLVLKLNAKQENQGLKCHWVESLDTPKVFRPVRRGHKKILIETNSFDAHRYSNSNRSYRQVCGSMRFPHLINNEENDDRSAGDTSEDSMESSESTAVSSPPLIITTKKAKVKVENNCYVPLPSPNSCLSSSNISSFHQNIRTNMKIDIPSPSSSSPPSSSSSSSSSSCSSMFPASLTIKKEPLASPVLTNNLDDDQRKRSTHYRSRNASEMRKQCVDVNDNNKWSTHDSDKANGQPPQAHSSSLIPYNHYFHQQHYSHSNLNHHHHSSSNNNNPYTASSSMIPVDLTRKSNNFSPMNPKSPLSK